MLIADCALLAGVPHEVNLLGPLAAFGIVAFAVFLGLGQSRLRSLPDSLPFSARLLCAHLVGIALVYCADLPPLHRWAFKRFPGVAHATLTGLLITSIVLLALACIPLAGWVRAMRVTGLLWLLASGAGVAALLLRDPFQEFWRAPTFLQGRILQVAAFRSVQAILRPLLHNFTANPDTYVIGTPHFTIFLAGPCSGMEGLALVLVFTAAWLWYFRKETRFPQAFLLVPVALATVWMLNIVRICAIVLIGSAGAPNVAMIGFHSQAGWISFTAVALAFSMAARKLSWVHHGPHYATAPVSSPGLDSLHARSAAHEGESPATPAYLVPFLAILAASFVSKAASGYFEWLYPLRFIAAAVALWHYRSEYRNLNWRFSGLAPLIGAGVFLAWISPEWISLKWFAHAPSTSPIAAGLAALPLPARWTWIAFRISAAVITVPISEELAFRGYLTRRIVSKYFDAVPFTSITFLSVALSSIAFGLMHGEHWMVGFLAGLSYAAALKWRGRIADAVVAHATSNLLLAAWVLLRGDWAQW